MDRQQQLEQQRDAALVKLDRTMAELERFGGSRTVDTIEVIADDLDVDMLKSMVFDLEAAKQSYETAKRELKRVK